MTVTGPAVGIKVADDSAVEADRLSHQEGPFARGSFAPKSTIEYKREYKFNLRGGKSPSDGFATVLDHIAYRVQSTYEDVGHEVATSLRTLKPYDWKKNMPVLETSTATDPDEKRERMQYSKRFLMKKSSNG